VVQLAVGRKLHFLGKLLGNLVIEHGFFAEPDIHASVDLRGRQFPFFEPERQDGIDANLVVISNRRFHAFA